MVSASFLFVAFARLMAVALAQSLLLPDYATLDVVSASRKENGQTLSSFTQKLSRGILRLTLTYESDVA